MSRVAVYNGLSFKQESFCQGVAAGLAPGRAWREAYRPPDTTGDATCATVASAALRNPKLINRIEELRAIATADDNAATAEVMVDARECFRRWVEIASADPDELIGLRIGCCRYCYGAGHGYQWREREYLEALTEYEAALDRKDPLARMPDLAGGFGYRRTLPPVEDCPECEGEGVQRVVARDTSQLSPGARALFGGVKQTRNGIEVIIADRTKALDAATRMLGGYNDKVSVDVTLKAMMAVVQLDKTDPAEASRVYQKMIGQHMQPGGG